MWRKMEFLLYSICFFAFALNPWKSFDFSARVYYTENRSECRFRFSEK